MITYKAPAKLNLFLDILGLREDGFHEIVSLLVKVDLFDELRISKSASKEIDFILQGEGPLGNENICVRAARLMLERFRLEAGVSIELQKNIPIKSGLGGASSDAAGVVKGINQIFSLGLSEAEMIELGALLGSDVPFFITEYSWAVASGRGEVLREISPKLNFWAILLLPDFGVETREAYSKWRASLTSQAGWDRIKFCRSEEIDFNFLKIYSYNVFERLLRREQIELFKKMLQQLGAEIVSLSGSGSAIYGIFSRREDALLAKERLNSQGYEVYMVKPL